MHITRRRLLQGLGLGGALLAVGGGSYLITRTRQASPPPIDPQEPFSIREGRIDVLERLVVEAPLTPLEPQTFVTTAGRQGWRVQLPAYRPLATPAVFDGAVYLGGGFGSYEFYAFDARSGALQWELHTDDDGPTAAVVFEDFVCFNTESCTLYLCDRRTGRIRWQKWLGDPLMNQPAVAQVGDRALVFMAYPAQDGHRLAAFTLRAGEEVWSAPLDADLISAPVVSDDTVYASAMSGIVYAFQASDGALLQEQRLNATSAPWVADGQILVSQRAPQTDAPPQENVVAVARQGNNQNQVGLALEASYLQANAQGRYQQEFAGYDGEVGFSSAPTSAQLHKAQDNLGGFASTVIGGWSYQGARPVVLAGNAYNVLGDTFQSADLKTHQPRWAVRFRGESAEDRAFAPPALAGGTLYAGSLDGRLLALRTQDGQVTWAVDLEKALLFQPAVAGGHVYLTTQNGVLYCLDAQDPRADGWPMWGGGPAHNGPQG